MALPGLSDKEARKIDSFINEFYRIDYNFSIEQKVIEIRKQKHIKIPDAIIATSAIYINSMLVTRNTKDFDGINNLKIFFARSPTDNPFENDLAGI